MYCSKLCQVQGRPSSSTAPGMSSTPSMNSTSVSRWSGLQGAKPTPQLPIIAVVTPFQDDGVISLLQVACAS